MPASWDCLYLTSLIITGDNMPHNTSCRMKRKARRICGYSGHMPNTKCFHVRFHQHKNKEQYLRKRDWWIVMVTERRRADELNQESLDLRRSEKESERYSQCVCAWRGKMGKKAKREKGMQKALGPLPAICNLLMARLVTRRCTASIFSDEVIFN